MATDSGDDALPIPAVTTETQEGFRRMTGGTRELNLADSGALPVGHPGPISDWAPSLSSSLSADVEDATRALVDFDSYAVRVLGADDPAIGPMSAILLRTESASSSQIENLTTSARQLALAELDETDKPNAVEVVGNVRAMEAALRLSERIDASAILAMHAELLSRAPGMQQHAGAWRDQLVWIGRDNAGPRGAEFVAPQPNRIAELVRDIVDFTAREDLPVVVQVAVSHAQFETIHPFVDGNGRAGRALAQALLRNKGLASHTTVPVSAGLLTDTTSYFAALTAFPLRRRGPYCAPIRRRGPIRGSDRTTTRRRSGRATGGCP